MVDPIIYANPYARYVPPPRHEPWPDGRPFHVINCPKCRNKGVRVYNAPYVRAYQSPCFQCGAMHVIKDRDLSWREVRNLGTAVQPPKQKRPDGTTLVEATRRVRELRRKRELGAAYWRNPD